VVPLVQLVERLPPVVQAMLAVAASWAMMKPMPWRPSAWAAGEDGRGAAQRLVEDPLRLLQPCTFRPSRARLTEWTLRRSFQRAFFEPCAKMNPVNRDAATKEVSLEHGLVSTFTSTRRTT
jgi:hypothetical protein